MESKKWPLGKYHKTALYADDLTLFKKNEQDMQQALGILAEFSTFSGLEINRMKSEAMWLGSKQNCTDTFFFLLYGRGDSKFLVCILPVTNVLLKLKRTGREGWKTLKE